MSSLGSILAAANATVGEHNPGERLPFTYVPTGWVGIVFLFLFGMTTTAHLLEALFFRTNYMIYTLVLCGLSELIGWAGRYWGHVNPHTGDAFLMQITTTIIAPSFMTAAMFLILPKIINELGVEYSRMPPHSKIFITADVAALVIQAAGGAMASTAHTLDGAERGGNVMLGGIVIQLVAVILYTILGLEFIIRFTYDQPTRSIFRRDPRKQIGWIGVPQGIVLMLVGLAIATVLIIIRSIYRTVELADGWHGKIIATEKWFNWFDGAPIVVAMITFNVFHPGYLLRNLESENKLPISQSSSVDRVEMGRV